MTPDAPNCGSKPQLVILGRAVRELRERHGVSADLLAARTSNTLQRIHELETGRIDPDYEELVVLAEKGLGIRLSALVAHAARCESQPRSR
jgi:transcriptional regulator with XRE-family HTH domain